MQTFTEAEAVLATLKQTIYAKQRMPMNPASKAEMMRQYEDALVKVIDHYSGAAPVKVHRQGIDRDDNLWAWWLDQITYAYYSPGKNREAEMLRSQTPELEQAVPALLKLATGGAKPSAVPKFQELFDQVSKN